MSHKEQHGRGQRDDALGKLLQQVPSRPQPPAEDAQAIRSAVHAAWKATHVRPAQLRLRLALVALALVVAAVLAVVLLDARREPGLAPVLAQVVTITGAAQVTAGGRDQALSADSRLVAGAVVTTLPAARLALHWGSGAELRVDADTRLELLAANSLRLLAGRIYVESGVHAGDRVLEIDTPGGILRPVGTRYQVRVEPGLTEIMVREGRVELARDEPGQRPKPQVGVGERLVVDAAGAGSPGAVPTWGDAWSWSEPMAPPFQGDGRTLAELLEWLARETGRSLSFSSPEVRRQAGDTILHGQLELGVDDALSVVSATTDFIAVFEGATLEVSIRP